MVLDPPTEALENRRFCIQRRPRCQNQTIHPRLESPCASVQLVDEVCRQGHGRRTCPGGMIICILNHDELYLAEGAPESDRSHQRLDRVLLGTADRPRLPTLGADRHALLHGCSMLLLHQQFFCCDFLGHLSEGQTAGVSCSSVGSGACTRSYRVCSHCSKRPCSRCQIAACRCVSRNSSIERIAAQAIDRASPWQRSHGYFATRITSGVGSVSRKKQ